MRQREIKADILLKYIDLQYDLATADYHLYSRLKL